MAVPGLIVPMVPSPRDGRVAANSREAILQQLREQPRTVDEMAAAIGLTPNGVRAQLATLEREGLVSREGVRRSPGVGKPPLLYAITAEAELRSSRAYPVTLRARTEALAARTSGPQRKRIYTAAGELMAEWAPRTAGQPIGDAAREMLESLGAVVTVAEEDGRTMVSGTPCPLAVVVQEQTESCEMIRALLESITGSPVATCCSHENSPRCRFAID